MKRFPGARHTAIAGTASTVEHFVAQLRAKGLSPSTVRQIYTVAWAIGDAAVADGLLGRNPFEAVRRPRVTTTEAAYLTPGQVWLPLEAASGSRYRPLFEQRAAGAHRAASW